MLPEIYFLVDTLPAAFAHFRRDHIAVPKILCRRGKHVGHWRNLKIGVRLAMGISLVLILLAVVAGAFLSGPA